MPHQISFETSREMRLPLNHIDPEIEFKSKLWVPLLHRTGSVKFDDNYWFIHKRSSSVAKREREINAFDALRFRTLNQNCMEHVLAIEVERIPSEWEWTYRSSIQITDNTKWNTNDTMRWAYFSICYRIKRPFSRHNYVRFCLSINSPIGAIAWQTWHAMCVCIDIKWQSLASLLSIIERMLKTQTRTNHFITNVKQQPTNFRLKFSTLKFWIMMSEVLSSFECGLNEVKNS